MNHQKPAPSPWKYRFVKSVLGLALAATAIYVSAWFLAAHLLRAQADRWIADQTLQGRIVSHAPLTTTGFPSRVILTVPDWELKSPITAGGWTWRTNAIRLWSHPWQPNRFTLDLAGEHQIAGVWTAVGLFAGLTAEQADFRPALTLDGRIDEFDTLLRNVRLSLDADTTIASLSDGGTTLRRQPSATPDQMSWRFESTIRDLTILGLGEATGFVGPIASAQITLELNGPATSGPLPTALDIWRQGGGTVEMRALSLNWPPLSVNGSGTVALDEQLQPVGAFNATFRGFFETVDTLKERGLVRPVEAGIVRAALGLFARTPNGATQPELNLSVTVQNQKLYTGPVTLMTLPPIVWPKDVVLP